MLMMKILSVTVMMTLFLTSVIKQGELILTRDQVLHQL